MSPTVHSSQLRTYGAGNNAGLLRSLQHWKAFFAVRSTFNCISQKLLTAPFKKRILLKAPHDTCLLRRVSHPWHKSSERTFSVAWEQTLYWCCFGWKLLTELNRICSTNTRMKCDWLLLVEWGQKAESSGGGGGGQETEAAVKLGGQESSSRVWTHGGPKEKGTALEFRPTVCCFCSMKWSYKNNDNTNSLAVCEWSHIVTKLTKLVEPQHCFKRFPPVFIWICMFPDVLR